MNWFLAFSPFKLIEQDKVEFAHSNVQKFILTRFNCVLEYSDFEIRTASLLMNYG